MQVTYQLVRFWIYLFVININFSTSTYQIIYYYIFNSDGFYFMLQSNIIYWNSWVFSCFILVKYITNFFIVVIYLFVFIMIFIMTFSFYFTKFVVYTHWLNYNSFGDLSFSHIFSCFDGINAFYLYSLVITFLVTIFCSFTSIYLCMRFGIFHYIHIIYTYLLNFLRIYCIYLLFWYI